MILCIPNGRYYIGKTSDAWRRWEEHYTFLKFGRYQKGKGNAKAIMQEDWKQYGKSRFAFMVLCERSNMRLIDDLERHLIKVMNPPYNDIHADARKESAQWEAEKIIVQDFLYSWLPWQLKEMPGKTFYNWPKMWARLQELRATGLSNRRKADFEEMLRTVYPEYFKIEGNRIARIKNFEK